LVDLFLEKMKLLHFSVCQINPLKTLERASNTAILKIFSHRANRNTEGEATYGQRYLCEKSRLYE